MNRRFTSASPAAVGILAAQLGFAVVLSRPYRDTSAASSLRPFRLKKPLGQAERSAEALIPPRFDFGDA
jgi:hypothetical protein